MSLLPYGIPLPAFARYVRPAEHHRRVRAATNLISACCSLSGCVMTASSLAQNWEQLWVWVWLGSSLGRPNSQSSPCPGLLYPIIAIVRPGYCGGLNVTRRSTPGRLYTLSASYCGFAVACEPPSYHACSHSAEYDLPARVEQAFLRLDVIVSLSPRLAECLPLSRNRRGTKDIAAAPQTSC